MLTKIREFVERAIETLKDRQEELFLVVVIILVGAVSFGIGRISVGQGSYGELRLESSPVSTQQLVEVVNAPLEQGTMEPTSIVGNKNSKIYHRSDCSGAVRMSEKNKIFFASITAAKTAGYRPAGNCPGLE